MADTGTTTRRRARLTRSTVLRRAVRIADEAGVEALTMRRLAEDLGVEAMSLYHHVPGKEAILEGVIEVVLDELGEAVDALGPAEVAAPIQWKGAVRTRILAARTVMLRHRWAPVLMSARDVMTLSAARHVDGIVALMRAGGFSYDLIHHGLHALGSRIFGFTPDLAEPEGGDSAAEAAMAAMATHVPNLAAMLAAVAHDDPDTTLGWCDDQREFEFGLDLLLDGLERLARA